MSGWSPLKGHPFKSKLNQGLDYDGEPLDKSPIEICKTNERLDILDLFWSGPFLNRHIFVHNLLEYSKIWSFLEVSSF